MNISLSLFFTHFVIPSKHIIKHNKTVCKYFFFFLRWINYVGLTGEEKKSQTHTLFTKRIAKNSRFFLSHSVSLFLSIALLLSFNFFFLFVHFIIKMKLPSHLHQSIINIRNESYYIFFSLCKHKKAHTTPSVCVSSVFVYRKKSSENQ